MPWQGSSYDCGQGGDNRNIHCFYGGSHIADLKALDMEQTVEQHGREVVVVGTCFDCLDGFDTEVEMVDCFVFC